MSAPKPMPSRETLVSKLVYDHETGKLSRRCSGMEAGCTHSNGYVYVSICGKPFMAHRIAWVIFFGEEPKSELDHINGNKADNRISNLREASHSENLANRKAQKNNMTGFKGVSYHKHSGRFMARAVKNGKTFNLGYFNTADEAHEAYKKIALSLHGDFASS